MKITECIKNNDNNSKKIDLITRSEQRTIYQLSVLPETETESSLCFTVPNINLF